MNEFHISIWITEVKIRAEIIFYYKYNQLFNKYVPLIYNHKYGQQWVNYILKSISNINLKICIIVLYGNEKNK